MSVSRSSPRRIPRLDRRGDRRTGGVRASASGPSGRLRAGPPTPRTPRLTGFRTRLKGAPWRRRERLRRGPSAVGPDPLGQQPGQVRRHALDVHRRPEIDQARSRGRPRITGNARSRASRRRRAVTPPRGRRPDAGGRASARGRVPRQGTSHCRAGPGGGSSGSRSKARSSVPRSRLAVAPQLPGVASAQGGARGARARSLFVGTDGTPRGRRNPAEPGRGSRPGRRGNARHPGADFPESVPLPLQGPAVERPHGDGDEIQVGRLAQPAVNAVKRRAAGAIGRPGARDERPDARFEPPEPRPAASPGVAQRLRRGARPDERGIPRQDRRQVVATHERVPRSKAPRPAPARR